MMSEAIYRGIHGADHLQDRNFFKILFIHEREHRQGEHQAEGEGEVDSL